MFFQKHIRRRWAHSRDVKGAARSESKNTAVVRSIRRDVEELAARFGESYTETRNALTELLRLIRSNARSEIQLQTFKLAVEYCEAKVGEDAVRRKALDDWAAQFRGDWRITIGTRFAREIERIAEEATPYVQRQLF